MGKKPILNKNGHFGKIPLSTTILPLMWHFKSLYEVFETENSLFTSPESIFTIVSLKPSNSRYHITKGCIFYTFGFFEKCNPLCNPFNGLHFLHFWFLNVCAIHAIPIG